MCTATGVGKRSRTGLLFSLISFSCLLTSQACFFPSPLYFRRTAARTPDPATTQGVHVHTLPLPCLSLVAGKRLFGKGLCFVSVPSHGFCSQRRGLITRVLEHL